MRKPESGSAHVTAAAALVSALAFTLTLTLADVVWAALVRGGARPRFIGLLRLGKLVRGWGIEVYDSLPGFWNAYYPLGSVAEVLALYLLSAAGTLMVVAAALVVLLPAYLAAARTERVNLVLIGGCVYAIASIPVLAVVHDWLRTAGLMDVGFNNLLLLAAAGMLVSIGLLAAADQLAGSSTRRHVAAGLLVLMGLGGLSQLLAVRLSQTVAPPAGVPNVLLISIDSLRADHLDSYGYSRRTSPNLSRLAAEGARFETVLSPTSWTLPSHVTMLTGMPPQQHQVITDGIRLPESAMVLAEAFRGAGYETAGFVSGPYLAGEYGHSQGFDSYDDYSTIRFSKQDQWAEVSSPALTRMVNDRFDRWDREGRNRPVFVFLHMFDVHFDYIPPPPYDSMFTTPGYAGPIDGTDVEYTPNIHAGMPAADLAQLIGLYDGEIRYVDAHIGAIVARLEELDALDDTIVAVTADHGEEFLDHGDRTHRKTLYEEVLRVPLMVRYPQRIAAGTVVTRPARLMDIPPTLLSLAGVEPSAGYWIEEAPGPWAPLDLTRLFKTDPDVPEYVAYGDLQGFLAAIRTADSKLITNVRKSGDAEVYDLIADPSETHDLSDDSIRMSALIERLTLWRERLPTLTVAPAQVDEEHMKILRALGYVR